MGEGVDQVGVARDWLRRHGAPVPDDGGAGPSGVDARREPERRARQGEDIPAREWSSAAGASAPEGSPFGSGLRTSDPTGSAPAEATSADDESAEDGGGHRGSRASRDSRGSRGRRSSRRSGGDGRGDDEGSARERQSDGRGAGDPDADPEEVARTIVLRKLAAQARTRAELARALRTKEVPEEAANAVLDRMSEVGLVDDTTFAHDWVASRQQRRHLSRTALRRELQTKGVDRDVIDEALVGVDGADEHRAALALAERRAATMAGLPREVAYRRLGGVLGRRGFSGAITTQVLSEVLGGWAED